MSSEWRIPDGLSPLGKKAAEATHQFFVDNDITFHGGGGCFYTPQEWAERGEEYGLDSVLVITHDGGSHAAAFNYDYDRSDLMENLREKLAGVGVYVEQCTSWYSAIHKS